jgi:transcriptional regulator with PAS, ATPase and Fis domain
MSNVNGYKNEEKVSLALVSTYPEMAKEFDSLAKQQGLTTYISFAALDEAVAVAKEIEPRMDAILSRGGTAEYIRRAVDIPVISIPITPFDVVRSIHSVSQQITEVAFFNFEQKMHGIRDIERMFNKTIYEYTFMNEQEVEEGVKGAKFRGIKVVIGGIVTVQLAQKHGLEGVLIKCGEASVYPAMLEAIHVSQVRRIERSRAVRLKVVFNSIAEGIIVTDEQNQVVIYNPAAERIFQLPENEVIGKNVQDIIPNTRMHKVFATGEPEMACLQEIHGGNIATNRLPIFLDDKPVGVVSTFSEVTKIQYLEQKIRKQIHAKGFFAKHRLSDILTNNPRLIELKELAALYATTQSSVLIEGESGTGKELFAQSIHNASQRVNGPFVAVNCAAIPENLLESELFGYEGGAFTGAKKEGKQGLFELAHNGTIFLDEIGEIPKSLQARLLRVVQEREIMRVGGDKIIPVDIRIISATNKNLAKKVEQGEFRDDLFYRLNVFNLKIPPLRERKEDSILLGTAFLRKLNILVDGKVAKELIPSLVSYDWPGNIRELHNVMERLALLVSHAKTPPNWAEMLHKVLETALFPVESITIRVNVDKGLKAAISQVEKDIVEFMLTKYDQDQDVVLQKLGIGRTTLWRKIKTEEI